MNRNLKLVAIVSLTFPAFAFAAQKKAPTPRDAEVENVKGAYWNRTANGEVEVVQNRLYAKQHRLSLQAGGGVVSSDPFTSIKSINGALGYHFTESFGVSVVGRKYFVSDSSYYNELRDGLVTGIPTRANTNRPKSYIGGELEYSPLYGKISLSGASIVHYDAHLIGGLGVTSTDSESLLTPTIGFGPQFYLGNSVAIRLDYRVTYFKETVNETIRNDRTTAGERNNFSHLFNLGLVLFL